jgi:hypothetical protein
MKDEVLRSFDLEAKAKPEAPNAWGLESVRRVMSR